MKKYLVVLLLTVVLLIATVSLASANGGPHGGYTATTDACAGCHRAHTATGPHLVMAASTYALCTSCHGSTGLGANTNVDDGKYLSTRDNAPAGTDGNVGAGNTPDSSNLLAGGFATYNSLPSTSAHSPNGTSLAAWGNGSNRGVGGTAIALDCASCHDPHGSTNYRIIKTTVNGNAVVVAQVDDTLPADKDYDTEQWSTGQSNVCAACHVSYHETVANVGSNLAAQTYGGGYTHRVDMAYNYGGNANPETVGYTDALAVNVKVPLAQSGAGDIVVCQTCHLPHGTNATMTTLADNGPSTDSALLRLDNRGVCEACHQK
jgi:predicted CXXCH cytochrome family protein